MPNGHTTITTQLDPDSEKRIREITDLADEMVKLVPGRDYQKADELAVRIGMSARSMLKHWRVPHDTR